MKSHFSFPTAGFYLIAMVAVISACSQRVPDPPPVSGNQFDYLPAAHTGVGFVNEIAEKPGRNVGTYDYMYNGGGVAAADFDGDGLTDLFFTGNDTGNKIYRNLGNFVFEDMTDVSGTEDPENWSTGVTITDINGDGLPDIYVSCSGPDYRDKPTRNRLFVNQGDFSFVESASTYGIDDPGLTTQSVFFDFDTDGDADLWVMNHAVRNWKNLTPEWLEYATSLPLEEQKRFQCRLYKNNGDGTFTDISETAGMNQLSFGLGIAVNDFNDDGKPDAFVANDYFIPDRLYINTGKGGFVEKAASRFAHTSMFSMGCDAADFTNNGLTDLVVMDMTPDDHYRSKTHMASMDIPEFRFLTEVQGFQPQFMFNALYRNEGNGVMSDIAHLAGVAKTDWSWAPLLADFDNDGWKDLYVSNGIYRDILNNDWRSTLKTALSEGKKLSDQDYFAHLETAPSTPLTNYLFRNHDGYRFSAVNNDWGLTEKSFSNGAVYADLDQDGDLDLVISNLGQPAFVCRNNSREHSGGGFIRFQMAEPEAFSAGGTRIFLYSDNGMQSAVNYFTRGFQSCTEPIIHFGTGASKRIDSAVVHWSNGLVSTLVNPEINRLHRVVYSPDQAGKRNQPFREKLFWDATDAAIPPQAVHKENRFDDFEKEILLPHRMSQLGPALAVADVNGDGLDDFYLGGALNESGVLYLQSVGGFFSPGEADDFAAMAAGEELGALFFDADGDGDPDLYVARGGGGEVEGQTNLLQDLLWINDGTGRFTLSKALPEIRESTRAVRAFDWDGDGDLDLFVGGRNTPGAYPIIPRSYLLENSNGKFTDVTADRAPDLFAPGMVTDAVFVAENDQIGLVITGEWMKPARFLLQDGYWLEDPAFLPEGAVHGWWNSILAADFNGDSKTDFVLGNLGLNNKFHPKADNPLYLFAGDFDESGSLDIVLSKKYKDHLVPVRGRECSSSQMPFITGSFETYHDFASASLTEIYGQQAVESALRLKADNFASVILLSSADGFMVNSLPVAAQVAPVQGMVTDDVNGSGYPDLIIAGNNFVTEVETTPYDSGKGLLLAGDGNGGFTTVYEAESGIFLPDDVRNILPIKVSSDQISGLLVASSNSRVRLLISTR